MQTTQMTCWGLYGGAGFIGQHLARSILHRSAHDRVVLLDIRSPRHPEGDAPLAPFTASGRLEVVHCDVRDSAEVSGTADRFDVIVNLAAVHREPGHKAAEYFATNVAGAENLCRLAKDIDCREMIFTSSISVYGAHDHAVNEHSMPQPQTAYGQSKLQAEEIHRRWAEQTWGRLSIIRPGVVFGPGEGGNVTRLVDEMLKRQRAILLRPDLPKAGIYIEELLDLVHWLRVQDQSEQGYRLVNGVSHENLTFNAFGRVLATLRAPERRALNVPAALLRLPVTLLSPWAGLIPAGFKLHPERLAKLFRANEIHSATLADLGYPFGWPLERALADWLERGL